MGWQTEVVVQLLAGNTIINPTGFFVYSGTPGAGNLIFSIAPASTTVDNFGNTVLGGGATSYQAGQTSQLTAGGITFLPAGGANAAGTIAASGSGIVLINSGLVSALDNSAQLAVESSAAAGVTQILLTASTLQIGDGATAQITLNPKMATPPNEAAVGAGTATLAQTEAFAHAVYQSMKNRGMFN